MTMVFDHGLIAVSVKEIAISEFKAKCLGILEQVRKTRKPIRVTRFGEPVAEVVSAISHEGFRQAIWINGWNRENRGRYCWTYRQLG